ncbi:hypothetical protein GCM10010269_16810 [Streptomyces humidus]|uniref:Uncharacterized protein n=1 Tax=Streptomyces humidus TaxID=52259 RepID=A0A918L2A6_9ACTN|nr:hypothetical protein GCM10010269_16810 [Streptomyces humidus]
MATAVSRIRLETPLMVVGVVRLILTFRSLLGEVGGPSCGVGAREAQPGPTFVRIADTPWP